MIGSAVWRGGKNWSVSLVGALLVGLSFGLLGFANTFTRPIELLLPLFLASCLIGFGIWLWHGPLAPSQTARVALWSLAGIVLLALVSAWTTYHSVAEGIPLTEALEQSLVQLAVGGVSGAAVGFFDVRKEEHRELANRIEQAVDATMDGVAVFDASGRYVSANQSFLGMFGLEDESTLLGNEWNSPQLTADSMLSDNRISESLMETGKWHGEIEGRRQDGTAFPIELSLNRTDNGDTVAVARDISEHTAYREALQAERAQFRALTENAPIGVITIDEHSVIQYSNDQFAETLGYEVDEIVGESLTMLIPDRHQEAHFSGIKRYLESDDHNFEQTHVELPGLHRDGHEVPLSVAFDDYVEDRQFIGAISDNSERKERERQLDVQATAMDNALDGMAVVDEDGTFVYLNHAHAALYGYDNPDDLLGMSWEALYSTAELERLYEDAIPTLSETGQWQGEAVGLRRDGSRFDQELSLNALENGEFVCVVRDISERKDAERRVKLLQEATLSFGTERDKDAIIESVVDISQSIIDYPMAIYWSYDEDEDRLVPTHGSDTTYAMLNRNGLSLDQATINEGMFQHRVFKGGEIELIEDYQTIPAEHRLPLQLGSVLYAPIGDYGLLGIASETREQLSQTNRYLVDILTRSMRTVFDRITHEQAIEKLQREMRTMVATTNEQAVAEAAIATAQNVLDFPLCGVWLADETRTKLEPAAWLSAVDAFVPGQPTFTADGQSLSWEAYETGTWYAFDDVRTETACYNPDTKMRSELIIPLGEYGVLNIASFEPAAFDETDVSLARILAANTETALGRAKHEAELEQQNDRLEFLNSLLRHDILNGMVVIQSRAQLLSERLSDDEKRHADTIDRWCVTIIDLVQHVRAMLDVFAGSAPIELQSINLSQVLVSEVDRVRSTYPDIEFSVSVPDGVIVRANDLLSEVLGNVVSNAVEHNASDDPYIAVSVTTDDQTAMVRVADNGPGVPDAQKEAIFRRDTTGHVKSAGSGFGLFFVDTMVSQYGGSVHVEDNHPTGAVFVITFPLATGSPNV
ncbi:PAS domain S-box protein [Haladaptatus sp. DJG-WS-42]|uniref:PAS domain S-box protein n=1 Tax=Haladaptatus sp. DJG-WS-42 TaxID=3120516 RepID=UPI0030D37734